MTAFFCKLLLSSVRFHSGTKFVIHISSTCWKGVYYKKTTPRHASSIYLKIFILVKFDDNAILW